MITLGLTGSIGMGKSVTAQMFRDEGIAVFDSDAAVHALYEGKAASLIEAAFPGSVSDGAVDRQKLSRRVLDDAEAMQRLEAIVHPLVEQERAAFLDKARHLGAALVVLDIPLLFETGAEARVSKVLVVTAPMEVQRQRVMARPGMSEEKFEAILARQLPDAEKRARADYVINTGLGLDSARQDVRRVIAHLTGR
jgi:dephospho-CoA kinase